MGYGPRGLKWSREAAQGEEGAGLRRRGKQGSGSSAGPLPITDNEREENITNVETTMRQRFPTLPALKQQFANHFMLECTDMVLLSPLTTPSIKSTLIQRLVVVAMGCGPGMYMFNWMTTYHIWLSVCNVHQH